jgi:hypothetical protein
MPTSVAELFGAADLTIAGRIRWGEHISSHYENGKGVYVVALSSSPDDKEHCPFQEAPLDENMIRNWIATVPAMRIDKEELPRDVLVSRVRERLSEYWLADEPILYVGMTGGGSTSRAKVKGRVAAYYRTELGKRSPHRGGHWLKTLSVLEKLHVFWALTPDCDALVVEDELLQIFADNATQRPHPGLYDRGGPFPFANIKQDRTATNTRNIKTHGIKPQTKK